MARIRDISALVGLVVAMTACSAPEVGMPRGTAVYDTCAPCHGEQGLGNQELGAPAIAGLPQWYIEASLKKYEDGWRGANPMDTVGLKMHSMVKALDMEGDRESVAEYVASLPRRTPQRELEVGDPQAGQQTFQVCVACHGVDGAGNQQVFAPPLVGQHDWYLLRQLRKFKKGWRGTHPDDTWGQTMRPNTLALTDADLENVVAYIQTLSQ
jgi:cytochrome c553